MLFVIDDSIAETVRDGSCTVEVCEALELLGMSLFEGKHRVTSSQNSLREFSRFAVLSRKSRAAFSEALNEFQADQSILKIVRVYAFVTPSVTVLSAALNDDLRRILVPVLWLDDSYKVQATCLVGENLTDCHFLERVYAVGRSKGLVGNCQVRFDFENGGGSTCAPVIESIASKAKFCCSVVDSDKEFPADSLGDTASAVQRFKDPNIYPTVGIAETIGRELENMIHAAFVARCFGSDSNHSAALKIIQHSELKPDPALRLHYDFKKGLTLGSVFKSNPADQKRQFWETKLTDLEALFNKQYLNSACASNVSCSTGPCGCRISNGLGSHILEHFVGDFDRHGEEKISKEIPPSIVDEWSRIALFLFDWGCARDRVRA